MSARAAWWAAPLVASVILSLGTPLPVLGDEPPSNTVRRGLGAGAGSHAERHADDAAAATQRSGQRTPRVATREPAWSIHGLGFVGLTRFAAKRTFEAVLGEAGGQVAGGGVRVAHRSGFFGQVDGSRFVATGERVFVSGGQVFKLGIPTEVTVTPVDVTGGYRYVRRPRTARPGVTARPARTQPLVIPWVGAGFGQVRYKESADFAKAGDDTDEAFRSYHLVGGVDVPIWRWLSAGVDAGYRWVPDALGQGGVSKEFGDKTLGGSTIRVRVLVGR